MSNAAPPPPPPQNPSASAPSQWGPPGGSSAKAGMPTWGKIAIGCGCLTLVAIAIVILSIGWGVKKVADSEAGASIGKGIQAAKAFAEGDSARGAELMIEMNPEFEVVENDPDNGRIKVRVKSSGEVGTIDYSDIEKGKFRFESDSGASFQVDGSEGSEGVVTYTDEEGNTGRVGMSQELPAFVPLYPGANVEEGGGFQSERGDTISGLAGYTTPDAFDDVVAWYDERLEADGYTVEHSTMSAGSNRVVTLNAKKEGVDQLVVAITQNEEGQVGINTQYSGKKP